MNEKILTVWTVDPQTNVKLAIRYEVGVCVDLLDGGGLEVRDDAGNALAGFAPGCWHSWGFASRYATPASWSIATSAHQTNKGSFERSRPES